MPGACQIRARARAHVGESPLEHQEKSTRERAFFNEVAPLGLMKERRCFANEGMKKREREKEGEFASLGRSPSSFTFAVNALEAYVMLLLMREKSKFHNMQPFPIKRFCY